MHSAGVTLISNDVANGAHQRWPGGRGLFVAIATDFSSESVTFEFLGPDGATWLPVPDVNNSAIEIEANGSSLFDLPPCLVRASVSDDGGTPTGIYAVASRVPS